MPSVFTVLRAITALFQHRPGCQSRPLRRLRLRPRLPVRPGRLVAEARRRASATSCSTCPTKSSSSTTTRPRPGTTATTIPATASRPTACRATARPSRSSRPTASRRAATTSPANMRELVEQGEGELPARRPVRGRARPDVLRALRNRAVGDLAPAEGDQPVALFLLHQSRRGRVSDRRLAGNVRAGQRPPRRDLPDLRHDQARRRRHLGFRADPEAAEFQEGRVRAHHVLGRRPQRQDRASASRARCASSAAARSRCIRA